MECGDKIPTMIKIKQEVDEEPESSVTGGYQVFFIKQEVEEEDFRQDGVEEDSRQGDVDEDSTQDDEVEMQVTTGSSSESVGNVTLENKDSDLGWQLSGEDGEEDEREEQSEMEAKRRGTTGKGSRAKAPARRAQKPPTPPKEDSSGWDVPEVPEEVPEVPQEDVPTPEEGTPEEAPSQAARRKEKKLRGAFKLKDQEEEAMVIEWIQENRLLWDQKDQNFKNKNQKDRLWAQKAQELGYEAQYLKTWYTDLRDFNTKLVRVQSGDGTRVLTAREQWVMGQFQFLKERIRHRRHPVHSSSAAAKAALKSGNLREAEGLAAEERRSPEDVNWDSTSSRRSSKRQRGSQEEVEEQNLEVLRKELAELQKRLTALQEREPDDERAAYMKYVSKVVCKSTEDAYEDFQRVFMEWQARWKAQRQQQQQQRYQFQQYQQHTKQHQWYQGSSESAQLQPPPHQWRQPSPVMQATSVWGSHSMDLMTHAYNSAAAGGPCPSGSTSQEDLNISGLSTLLNGGGDKSINLSALATPPPLRSPQARPVEPPPAAPDGKGKGQGDCQPVKADK